MFKIMLIIYVNLNSLSVTACEHTVCCKSGNPVRSKILFYLKKYFMNFLLKKTVQVVPKSTSERFLSLPLACPIFSHHYTLRMSFMSL